MRARLALHQGVLFLATTGATGRLRLFDLDGRRLEGGFEFASLDPASPLRAGGFAVDEDRRIWLADEGSAAVRCFNVFGVETHRFGPPTPEGASRVAKLAYPDSSGVIGRPAAIAVQGSADDLQLLVGSSGPRRHGLQLFGPGGELLRSLRPRGDSHGSFAGVSAVALSGELAFAVEAYASRVQVFRRLEHLFSFDPQLVDGETLQVLAPVGDGRLLAAISGPASRVVMLDSGGVSLGSVAGADAREGELDEPTGVVVDWTGEDRTSRVCIVDAGGERVQVFSLDGRCFGSFEEAQA